jgi:hypothetical protein
MNLIQYMSYLEYIAIPSLKVNIGRVRSTVRMDLDDKLHSISIHADVRGRHEEYKGKEDVMGLKGLSCLRNETEEYL